MSLPPGPRTPPAFNLVRFAVRGIRRCLGASLALAEMAEVLRVAVPAVDLRPVRPRPDPVVLRGITLAPRHGVEVEVARVRAARPAPLAQVV